MKKVIFALVLIALVISCKDLNEGMAKIDAPIESTSADSVKADLTHVDSTAVANDTVK